MLSKYVPKLDLDLCLLRIRHRPGTPPMNTGETLI